MTLLLCLFALVAAMPASPGATGAVQTLPPGTIADRIVVEKAARTLSVYRGGRLLKTYRIALVVSRKVRSSRKATDGRRRASTPSMRATGRVPSIALCTFPIRIERTGDVRANGACHPAATS